MQLIGCALELLAGSILSVNGLIFRNDAQSPIDIRQPMNTVYLYSKCMDDWARMRAGISSTEQVLRANIRYLQEELMSDPNCNMESISETLVILEATLLALDDARDQLEALRD